MSFSKKFCVCITKVAVFFTQRHEGFEITGHPWWSLCLCAKHNNYTKNVMEPDKLQKDATNYSNLAATLSILTEKNN